MYMSAGDPSDPKELYLPLFLYFFFSTVNVDCVHYKMFLKTDSNCRPRVSELTALPTLSQPLT